MGSMPGATPTSVGSEKAVIRDHWPQRAWYQDALAVLLEESPRSSRRLATTYDSTLGFNDAVGFRNGTTQVFRPMGAQRSWNFR